MEPNALADGLGVPLFSFCVAADPDDVEAWIGDEGEQPRGAAFVLDRCSALVEAAVPTFPRIREAFCDLEATTGRPPALEMHLAAGGQLPMANAGDHVAMALSELAAASFPTLLLAEPARAVRDTALKHVESILSSLDPNLQIALHPSMPDTPQIEGSLFPLVLRHPRFDALLHALEADPPFANAFAAGPRSGVRTMIWTSSWGHAQTVQLPSMPWMLLVDGYRRVRALGRGVRLADFVSEVLAALELARRAASKGRCEVPALVVMRGGHVQPGKALNTAFGKLHALTPLQRELAPSAAGGELALETTITTAFSFAADLESAQVPAGETPPWMLLREQAWRLAEAALLSYRTLLLPCWLVSLQPFAAGVVPVPEPTALSPPLRSAILGDELSDWTNRLNDGDSTVALARSRLVSALLRPDPTDGVVDAVVAWEALFGDSSGELRFRIAAAMAWLLAPDDADSRDALFTEVRDLYDVRSRLVHGGASPPFAELSRLRSRATEIGVAAVLALYADPRGLVAEKQRRSQILALRGSCSDV
jgi:hypothetical protein